MKILITNDDGIASNGLLRLAKAAQKYGEVYIVAPDKERSAASHSITLRSPIAVWQVDYPLAGVKAYACDGHPADCVRVGALNIVPDPDFLFSGINYGYNSATDLQYSATVAAALEGSFQKIHSIAFSEDASANHEVTDAYLDEVMKVLMQKELPAGAIWNVNFPSCPLSKCGGIRYDCTASKEEFYSDRYELVEEKAGKAYYKVVGTKNWNAKEGTDLRAIIDGCVSVGLVYNIH